MPLPFLNRSAKKAFLHGYDVPGGYQVYPDGPHGYTLGPAPEKSYFDSPRIEITEEVLAWLKKADETDEKFSRKVPKDVTAIFAEAGRASRLLKNIHEESRSLSYKSDRGKTTAYEDQLLAGARQTEKDLATELNKLSYQLGVVLEHTYKGRTKSVETLNKEVSKAKLRTQERSRGIAGH